jgi:putative FmdB family regulatory protein
MAQTRKGRTRIAQEATKMPTYVYECRPCNTVFTQVRASEDRDLPATCRKCGAISNKRLFAQPFVIALANRTVSPREAEVHAGQPENPRQSNFLIENVGIVNFKDGTGLRLSGGISVEAGNTYFSGNGVAIEVRDTARLHDEGTLIE